VHRRHDWRFNIPCSSVYQTGKINHATRRAFIFAAAAGAAMLTRISSALAATYDLVIKGGRVIDPAARINAMRDVAIVGGRIAAIESNIAADGAQTLDARGKLVVPGL
jgi:dihydroorotase